MASGGRNRALQERGLFLGGSAPRESTVFLSRPRADKIQSCRWQSHAGRELCQQERRARPKNRPSEEGDDSDPGLASRRDCVLTLACGGQPAREHRAARLQRPRLRSSLDQSFFSDLSQNWSGSHVETVESECTQVRLFVCREPTRRVFIFIAT